MLVGTLPAMSIASGNQQGAYSTMNHRILSSVFAFGSGWVCRTCWVYLTLSMYVRCFWDSADCGQVSGHIDRPRAFNSLNEKKAQTTISLTEYILVPLVHHV